MMNRDESALRADGRPVAPADAELFAHIERNLYTAVLSDALDDMGMRDRAMREHLRPIAPEHVLQAGRARSVAWMCTTSIPILTGSRLKRSTVCWRVKW